MKPVLLVSIGLLAVPLLAPGGAAEEFEGNILIGNPASRSPVFALGTRLGPCNPTSPWNGIDSVWFRIGTGEAPRTATLTMDATLDADAYFWDQFQAAGQTFCRLIQDFSCQTTGFGLPESCAVPAEADHVTVEGFLGTGAFRLVVA